MRVTPCVVVALVSALALHAQAPATVPLDELQALRVENFLLKHQPTLTQCQAYAKQTDTDWNALEKQIRVEMKIQSGFVLNLQTKAFEPQSAPPPAPSK